MKLYIHKLLTLILFYFSFTGCSFEQDGVKVNQSFEEKEILKVFVSERKEIIIEGDTIYYCNLAEELKFRLVNNDLMPGYIKLLPDSSLDMMFVNCIVDQIKKTSVDSIGLGILERDYTFNIKNENSDEDTLAIIVHVPNNHEVIVNNDTVAYNNMKVKISQELYGQDVVLIKYSLQKGVSFNSLLLTDRIITSMKEELRDKVTINVNMHECPYCPVDNDQNL